MSESEKKEHGFFSYASPTATSQERFEALADSFRKEMPPSGFYSHQDMGLVNVRSQEISGLFHVSRLTLLNSHDEVKRGDHYYSWNKETFILSIEFK